MSSVAAAMRGLPEVFTTRDAIAAGISPKVVRRLLRGGHVIPLGRGVYGRPDPQDIAASPDRARDEHLRRARAALLCHPKHVLSHRTAAAAYGWPVLLAQETPVELTAVGVLPRSDRLTGIVLHHCDSLENEVVLDSGLSMTTPARTVADCLRTMRTSRAVAVADAATRSGAVDLAQIRATVEAQRRWRGRPRAQAALPLVDPRRETWLESVSFVELFDEGIALPTPQVEIYDEYDQLVARVDGMWIDQATVGEADGRLKYSMRADGSVGVRPDSDLAVRHVLAEKRREDGIRGLGLEVVRWDFEQVTTDISGLARRVRRAQARGDLSRFAGRLRVGGSWVDLPNRTPRSDRFRA